MAYSGKPQSVDQGGTGASTLTDHGVLVGSGTSAVDALVVGTNGQVLVGSSAADPVFATLSSSDSSVTFSAGAGTLGLVATAASTTQRGTSELATDAEVKTGTDTARVSPVSSMIAHEGIAKAWVNFGEDGTIADSFNVTSVTDNGTGDYTINFTTAFATANYAAAGDLRINAGGTNYDVFCDNSTAPTSSAYRVRSILTVTYTNVTQCTYVFYGDR